MIALNFCLPSMANKLNSFCGTRTLCSTYYTRELSHLNLGRGTRARAYGCTKGTYPGKRKVRCKNPVFLNENLNSGKTLARSSFVFEVFCALRGFKRERLKEL